jgi:hypothetical protein
LKEVLKNNNLFGIDGMVFPKEDTEYLDKSFEVLHYLFCGLTNWQESAASPLIGLNSFQICDGEVNCFYFDSKEVARLSVMMQKYDETWLNRKLNQENLQGKKLYGFGYGTWEQEYEYYKDHFESLKEFYAKAASENKAIIVDIG